MTPFNALPSPAMIAALRKSPAWITAAALLALVAGFAFFGASPAHAQDPDGERYIDLEVQLVSEAGPQSGAIVAMFIANLGNLTAYDVEVTLTRTRHVQSLWTIGELPPRATGTKLFINNVMPPDDVLLPNGTFGPGFILNVPEIPAHTEYMVYLSGGTNPLRVYDLEAKITANGSHESADRLYNNSAKHWQNFSYSLSSEAKPDYSVTASVDDRHPAPGDTVNFTVQAERSHGAGGEQYFAEGCVNIKLTGGLTAGTPSFDPATDRSFETSTTRECGDTNGADGFFLLPDVHSDSDTSTMILPVTIDSNVTVAEQCLTAEIYATPPTGAGEFLDDPYDNRVEVCIDDPPPEVFDEGEVRTWTLFACKDGVADDACDTAEEVDVRVLASVLLEAGEHGNPDKIRVFDNATAFIHVEDLPGRVFDAHTGSVTDGTTVSWQTATDENMDCTGTRAGVATSIYLAPVNRYIDNWTNYRPDFTVSGLGRVHTMSDELL